MTGKKKFLTLATTLFASVGLGVGVIAVNGFKNQQKLDSFRAGAENKTITLNSAVFGLSSLTTTYQPSVKQNFGGEKGCLNYYLAKKDGSGNLVLAPNGRVFNYDSSATYKGRVTDIHSVTINYTGGQLYLQAGLNGKGEVYDQKIAVTSGTPVSLPSHPNFVMIQNSEAETTITSIQFEYSCVEDTAYSVNKLGTLYTGTASDGNFYEFKRNGENISGIGQNGTIAVTNEGVVTMTLIGGGVVYTGTVSEDHTVITVTSKSGAYAAGAPDLDKLYRAYVVDDFESYTQDGEGYAAKDTTLFTASDLRASYYVDIGGGTGASSTNTWITKSGFKVADKETDYLKLSTAVKHSGNQSITLVNNGTYWSRMWNIDTFNTAQHFNFGSGNKFSFWTHGAYADADCTEAYTKNVPIRAQVYYENFEITDSERNNHGTGTQDFTVAANSGWVERVINIDPTKKVMGINIMINNQTNYVSRGDECYLPIDDMVVYTKKSFPPQQTYAESATQFTKSYNVKLNEGTANEIWAKLELGANGYGEGWAGNNFTITSYTVNGNQIEMVIDGSYGDYTFGTWTGTLSNDKSTITIDKATGISGTIKNVITESTIILTEDTVVEDGSNNVATMKENLVRQVKDNGNWVDDTETEDRIGQSNDYYVQGNSSISMGKWDTSGGMRLIMNQSYANTIGEFGTISFWIFIPADITYKFSIYLYDTLDPLAATIKDGVATEFSFNTPGWHFISRGRGSALKNAEKYAKNFAIIINNTSVDAYIDYLTVY